MMYVCKYRLCANTCACKEYLYIHIYPNDYTRIHVDYGACMRIWSMCDVFACDYVQIHGLWCSYVNFVHHPYLYAQSTCKYGVCTNVYKYELYTNTCGI